jgi:hypothetical protein
VRLDDVGPHRPWRPSPGHGCSPVARPRAAAITRAALRIESSFREQLREVEMAVGVLAAAPEFTRQVYDNVTEKMFGHSPMRADEAPDGLILHSAGQGEQGFYVYDVWESREAFDRFMEERLGPAMAEVMGGPPPEGGAPQFFPIDLLVVRG